MVFSSLEPAFFDEVLRLLGTANLDVIHIIETSKTNALLFGPPMSVEHQGQYDLTDLRRSSRFLIDRDWRLQMHRVPVYTGTLRRPMQLLALLGVLHRHRVTLYHTWDLVRFQATLRDFASDQWSRDYLVPALDHDLAYKVADSIAAFEFKAGSRLRPSALRLLASDVFLRLAYIRRARFLSHGVQDNAGLKMSILVPPVTPTSLGVPAGPMPWRVPVEDRSDGLFWASLHNSPTPRQVDWSFLWVQPLRTAPLSPGRAGPWLPNDIAVARDIRTVQPPTP